jgi:uncharacterized protein with FMN-binding domain
MAPAHTVFLPISYTFLKFVCYTQWQNQSKLCVFCKDNQTMKKAVVSLIIIGAFVIYSIIHANPGLVAIVANTPGDSPSSSSSATTNSSVDTTLTSNATQTPGTVYRDGSYTGSVDDAQWGFVQVKAIITNGKITDVKFLQYPNDRSRSIYINSIADPQLTSEAIQAQSANVDIVTGATDSSLAFMQSLTDALSQAQA